MLHKWQAQNSLIVIIETSLDKENSSVLMFVFQHTHDKKKSQGCNRK